MMFRRAGMTLIILLLLSPVQSQTRLVDDILAGMSLEQKVGQMFVMSFFGTELNLMARDLVSTWQPGAIVLLPSNLDNPQQITALTNDIQQTLLDSGSVPAFIAVDQEGGIIAHLEEGFTRWAVPTLLTATQNPDLAYQFGEALAEELRAVGINMNLAPVADLQTNPDNPIIGRRSFGDDPQQVAPIIASVIAGMQSAGVMATVKHFPGHGDTSADSHLELPVLNLSEDDLFSRELIPFQSAIEAGTGAIMVAHIYFPSFDSDVIPSSLSGNIIENLLRTDMGYDGIVITDALDMDAIDTVYSPSESAIRAIQAGNDLVLLGAHISPENQAEAMQAVVDAVRAGTISETRIDNSVRRILQAKSRFDVLTWQELERNGVEQRINSVAHQELLQRLFREGITLVYDDGASLPLSGTTLMIYSQARGTLGLACNRNNWQFMTIPANPSADTIATIQRASMFVDNVVVFTENVAGNQGQINLIEGLAPEKTVIVALWSPFDSDDLPSVSGYFVTYSPLSESYIAMCDILHGEAEAQGTLSVALEPR